MKFRLLVGPLVLEPDRQLLGDDRDAHAQVAQDGERAAGRQRDQQVDHLDAGLQQRQRLGGGSAQAAHRLGQRVVAERVR